MYRLVARDAHGAVLTTAGMRVVRSADAAGPHVRLRVDVPAAHVAGVEIVKDATVLAKRTRSAKAPRVTVLSPKRGATVGSTRNITVRWRARDADSSKLTAKVDYSTNGGRSYRTIFTGPETGRAKLPSSLFAVTGRGLWWYAGCRELGSGERISARLAAGTKRVRLVARDARGRSATARARVRVTAVAPQFLRLDAPATIKTTASRITLKVASTIPATLTVRGSVLRVNRAVKRIVLPVCRASGPLSLTLRVKASGKTTRVRLAVPRV